MKIKIYRYEDELGFGPFWNIYNKKYSWKDDNFRDGCLSIEELNAWFKNSASDIDLSKYKIKEYLVDMPPKDKRCIKYNERIYKIYREDGTVCFNLDWVKN